MHGINRNMRVSFGADDISGGKAEDRGYMKASHAFEGYPNTSSFAVFDGHNGSMAASICSQFFTPYVLNRVRLLTSVMGDVSEDFSELSDQDMKDAIMCESIRLTVTELDENIQASHHSGTTLNALFMVQGQECTRVYCANVGDSRSVMYVCDGDRNRTSFNSDMFQFESEHGSSRKSAVNRVFRRHLQLSEDHKLTLLRERERLEEKVPIRFKPLPSDITVCEMIVVCEEEDDGLKSGFLEWGYPPKETLTHAAKFIKETEAHVDVSPKSIRFDLTEGVKMLNQLDATGLHSNEEAGYSKSLIDPEIQHQDSFIGVRRSKAGQAGPEAVFGRYNLSINMTRSLGDKFGPRCVVAVPEVSVVNVANNTFARFVIASDGVWDVLSNAFVKTLVFRYRHPGMVASKIAEAALLQRNIRHMRVDDISVIVIDVNDYLFPSSFSNCGCAIA